MTKAEERHLTSATGGIILHARAFTIFWPGSRCWAFRERVIDLARVKLGESVLDVGCGTGTQVGSTGKVFGIDASPEMLERAGTKARKADLDIVFKIASIDALSFPDAQFDVVLNSLMLHFIICRANFVNIAPERCAGF